MAAVDTSMTAGTDRNAALRKEMDNRELIKKRQQAMTGKNINIGGDPKDPEYSSSLDTAATAAGSTGNPYGIAAMIALKAISASKKADYQDNVQRRTAQLEHRNQMSSALDGLISTTRNLRL